MGTLAKAAAIEIAATDDDNHQYLAFSLGGETYAIAILRIKEIISYGQLTTVPMMPSFIRGVINLRGSVVPVVDLRARFGAQPTQVQRRTCIVIIEAAEGEGDTQDVGHAWQCSRGPVSRVRKRSAAAAQIPINLHDFPWNKG